MSSPSHSSTAWLQRAVEEAVARNVSGYNIDFEPNTASTEADGVAYAAWLTRFGDALHAAGKVLSVDVGHADAGLWNFSALAASSVDEVVTMGTYCAEFSLFKTRLQQAVELIGTHKLTVGLMSTNPNTGKPFALDEVQERFNAVAAANVQRLAIWQAPVPDNWWPLIRKFAA